MLAAELVAAFVLFNGGDGCVRSRSHGSLLGDVSDIEKALPKITYNKNNSTARISRHGKHAPWSC